MGLISVEESSEGDSIMQTLADNDIAEVEERLRQWVGTLGRGHNVWRIIHAAITEGVGESGSMLHGMGVSVKKPVADLRGCEVAAHHGLEERGARWRHGTRRADTKACHLRQFNGIWESMNTGLG